MLKVSFGKFVFVSSKTTTKRSRAFALARTPGGWFRGGFDSPCRRQSQPHGRAAAGPAVELQHASDEHSALTHPEQAERLAIEQFAGVKPAAVIGDLEDQAPIALAEVECYLPGASMAGHVGQTFLEDSEKRDCLTRAQFDLCGFGLPATLDASATGKILGAMESPGHWIHVTPTGEIFIGSLTGNVFRWYPGWLEHGPGAEEGLRPAN